MACIGAVGFIVSASLPADDFKVRYYDTLTCFLI